MPIIRYTLESDTAGFNSGMGGATSSMAGATNMAGKLSAGILALGASVKKLTDFVVDTVDEVNTLSKSSGLTTAQVNGLRLAAKATGKELKDIVPKNLARNMRTAAQSGGTMAKAFEDAGVEFENFDGSMRESSEVFPELIQSLSEMENRTDAAAIAAELMGKKGGELLSAFDDTAGFEHFVDLGNEFGIRTGPEAVKAAGEWQVATGNLALAFENAGQKLLDSFGGPGKIAELVNGFSLGFTLIAESASEMVRLVSADFAIFGEGMDKLLSGDFSGANDSFQSLTSSTDKLKESLKVGTERAQKFFELSMTGAHASGDAIEDETGQVHQLADAFNAAEQAAADLAGIQESMATAQRQAYDDTFTAEDRALIALNERNALIREQEQAMIALASTSAEVEEAMAMAARARIESVDRFQRDTDALAAEARAEQTAAFDEAAAEEMKMAKFVADTRIGEEERVTQAQIALRRAVAGVAVDIANELAAAGEFFAQMRQDQLGSEIETLQARAMREQEAIDRMIEAGNTNTEVSEARLANTENEIRAKQEALTRAFNAERAASLASIAVNAAQAVIGMTAFLAPLIGPAAPLAALTAVGVPAGIQAGIVLAQKPPKLHGGTSNSDEVLATIRSNEAVMSQRGAEAVGRDNIDAANSGQAMASGGGGVNQIVFQRRVLDQMMSRTIKGGGATSRLIAKGRPPSGIVDPFGGV